MILLVQLGTVYDHLWMENHSEAHRMAVLPRYPFLAILSKFLPLVALWSTTYKPYQAYMDGQKIEIQHACWLLHSFWKLLVCLCCLQHWILLNCEYCFAAQSTHFRFRLQKIHSRVKTLEIPRVPHWQFDCARFACSCGQFELKKLKYISTRHPRPEFSGHIHVQVRWYYLLRPLGPYLSVEIKLL